MDLRHGVRYEDELAKYAVNVQHNRSANYVREAMAEAGWVNPDSHGHIYYHPKIVGPNSDPIAMHASIAIEIQKVWEELEETSTKKEDNAN